VVRLALAADQAGPNQIASAMPFLPLIQWPCGPTIKTSEQPVGWWVASPAASGAQLSSRFNLSAPAAVHRPRSHPHASSSAAATPSPFTTTRAVAGRRGGFRRRPGCEAAAR